MESDWGSKRGGEREMRRVASYLGKIASGPLLLSNGEKTRATL
jgi:hypothetical protein